MATVRIPVKPDILKWVSNQSGNLLTDDWKSKLEQWTKQEKQPTVNQLKQLSQKTRIPFGYFFLANYKFNPNKPGIFQWQSVDDVFLMVVD